MKKEGRKKSKKKKKERKIKERKVKKKGREMEGIYGILDRDCHWDRVDSGVFFVWRNQDTLIPRDLKRWFSLRLSNLSIEFFGWSFLEEATSLSISLPFGKF